MAEIIFKGVVSAGDSFNWTYLCYCGSPREVKEITVTSGNRPAADNLAQLECDDHCNKPLDSRESEL